MLYHFGTLDDDPSSHSWAGRKAQLCERDNLPLWIYLLTPGFTLGYHQRLLGVSGITLSRHLADAVAQEMVNPSITDAVRTNADSITPEDGLRMALRRGTAHLPYWSRLAIGEFYGRLGSTTKVAELFKCSATTITNVVKLGAGPFNILSAERRLSPQQVHPPGQWRKHAAMTSRPD